MDRVTAASQALKRLVDSPVSVMEVCGTHTVSIFRSGIRSLLPPELGLVSGPGCPVCVTDQGEIDCALSLLDRGAVVAAYGDMFRARESGPSLPSGEGFRRRVVTSAFDLLAMAERDPPKRWSSGGRLRDHGSCHGGTADRGLEEEFAIFRCSPFTSARPALASLSADPELRISGFLLPGHVSVILGHAPFSFLASERGIPSVIAGFEPEQIVSGLVDIALQLRSGKAALHSVYGRAVRPEGNRRALELMDRVFEPRDSCWRGLGLLAKSGLALRAEFSGFDAEKRFELKPEQGRTPPGCRCGDVLTGRITPHECPLFGSACTPASPTGPCMVSAEGTCGAYFKFSRRGGGSR